MKRISVLFSLLLFTALSAQGYRYQVEIQWDAFAGEAEGVIQYYHDGKVELIRGGDMKGSSDKNVELKRTFDEGKQVFFIRNGIGKLFNIWVRNAMADEGFSSDEDMKSLAATGAKVVIFDKKESRTYESAIPEGKAGIAFHAGMIVDNSYTDVSEMFPKLKLVRLQVIDALSGEPAANAAVLISDPRIGRELLTLKTDEQGRFEAQLEIGKYRAAVAKDGYMEGQYDFSIDYSELPFAARVAIAPKIDKLRIILTWGPQPKDLDAHLAGPDPDGGKFHIWYRNMRPIGGKNFLDIDNTKGYGPETMTIYKPARGVYYYAVHNYSDRGRSANTALSYSGAVVQVYNNSRLIASFRPKKGKTGTVWNVFKIDENYRVIPVDSYYNADSGKEVFQGE